MNSLFGDEDDVFWENNLAERREEIEEEIDKLSLDDKAEKIIEVLDDDKYVENRYTEMAESLVDQVLSDKKRITYNQVEAMKVFLITNARHWF